VLTSPEVVLQAEEIIAAMGKTVAVCKDTPGFIVNRVARPFYGEALRMYEEGIADFATIDYAMTSIGGFKMGPFELMDYIGNDVNYTVTETVFEAFYFDPRFKPSFTQKRLKEAAPSGYSVDYAGPSRQFKAESGGFLVTMVFAVLIVFLVLAAQFESFRDPLVILVSVPLALFGALIFINLGFTTLNVYTQVGLVTLMGLISKHGILIVEFANELQEAGRSKLEAIIEASSVRLRPILMTTAAMVLGVVPLVIASGAGAAGRQSMGIVIFTGLAIGTLFTLFVVPAMYLYIGADHQQKKFKQA